jgi:hypothetical protein
VRVRAIELIAGRRQRERLDIDEAKGSSSAIIPNAKKYVHR